MTIHAVPTHNNEIATLISEVRSGRRINPVVLEKGARDWVMHCNPDVRKEDGRTVATMMIEGKCSSDQIGALVNDLLENLVPGSLNLDLRTIEARLDFVNAALTSFIISPTVEVKIGNTTRANLETVRTNLLSKTGNSLIELQVGIEWLKAAITADQIHRTFF